MNKKSDQELIKQLRTTQYGVRREALTYIYKATYFGIADFVLKNSGTEEDAKDIFQEAITIFYEKLVNEELVLTTSIYNYLYAIVRNLWMKKLRKSRRENNWRSKHDEMTDDKSELELIIERERNEVVRQLMSKMGDKCRKVLTLFYFDQKNMKEIMEEMNWNTVQSAKNKKSLCMKKIKKMIQSAPALKKILLKD